jgi:hypothetical protein
MFDELSLELLRQVTTEVSGNADQPSIISDSDIIQHLNKHFSTCNLPELAFALEEVTAFFEHDWDVAFWELSDGSDQGTLLTLYYLSQTVHGNVRLVRRFTQEDTRLVAYHDLLDLPEKLQDGGTSRAINKAMYYNAYKQLGIKKIKVHAALQAGGYVWAKAGFSAVNKYEVLGILHRAVKRISDGDMTILTYELIDELEQQVERFYASSKGNFPLYIWAQRSEFAKDLLLGTNWHGELNFDEPVPVGIFELYINKQ